MILLGVLWVTVLLGSVALAMTLSMARITINRIAGRYPFQPGDTAAEWRGHQRLTVGTAHIGRSARLGASADWIHIVPGGLLARLGALPASIPRAEVRLIERGGEWVMVAVGEHALCGPAWCLDPSSVKPSAATEQLPTLHRSPEIRESPCP